MGRERDGDAVRGRGWGWWCSERWRKRGLEMYGMERKRVMWR